MNDDRTPETAGPTEEQIERLADQITDKQNNCSDGLFRTDVYVTTREVHRKEARRRLGVSEP